MHAHRLALVGLAVLTTLFAATPVRSAEVPFDTAADLLTDFDGAAAVALGPPRRHGVPTFATCARNEGRVEYWVGSGGGAFGHTVAASGLDSPTALALGDLDGDGDDDIVVGQYNNIPLPDDPPFSRQRRRNCSGCGTPGSGAGVGRPSPSPTSLSPECAPWPWPTSTATATSTSSKPRGMAGARASPGTRTTGHRPTAAGIAFGHCGR